MSSISNLCYDNSNSFLNVLSPCITDSDNATLIRMPTHDEIKDRLPPGFYQKMWDIVGNGTVKMVQSFFHSKHMLRENNHNFISLIPMTNFPKTADEFRPISLCNISYKIISKLIDIVIANMSLTKRLND